MSLVVALVVARAPVPGQAKTRLAAAVGAVGAAEIAAAALLDTLEVVRELGTPSVVALTGQLEHCARRHEIQEALAAHGVIGQRGTGLGERLANAHADAAGFAGADAVVQVGMDTPQLTADLLRGAITTLDGADAAMGPAADGGWWCLAVRNAALAHCLAAVPMSRPDTGVRTRAALERAGVRVARLPELSDVDTLADAVAVAGLLPGSRFAAAVAAHAGLTGGVPQ
ncbi:MAG: TIGR04282 family arsenosugar biosynthesis glycosyltransferase [Nocardioidaceae bacterium]